MEEPQRSQVLDSFKILNAQFSESVDKARNDLQAGAKLEDLIVGATAEFSKGDIGSVAAALVCRLLWEAKKPVPKPRKKTAVVAKRATRKEIPDAV